MEQVTGLLFGHYSDDIPSLSLLFAILERFGKTIRFPLLIVMTLGMESIMQFFLLAEKLF